MLEDKKRQLKEVLMALYGVEDLVEVLEIDAECLLDLADDHLTEELWEEYCGFDTGEEDED